MEAATRQEMRFNLFVENTVHRARFRGSLVKFSNNPYVTYDTPEIGTFTIPVLYMDFWKSLHNCQGQGDCKLACLGAA